MIDDITYTYGPGTVILYRIYRDGTLVGTVPSDQTTFVDKTADSNTKYVYGVTAVYFDGESEATIATDTTTGINGVSKAEKTFDVYTIDGIRVATNVSNFSTMKKGVYIVNGKKVIVK